MEDLYIKKIKGLTMQIKSGKLEAKDSKIGVYLNKLKPLNIGMYEELLNKYMVVIN